MRRYFTWEEKNLFEEAVLKYFPMYYPLFLTALRTGMRIGEVIALQPGDLDFNGRFIDVRRNFAKAKLTTPKSGKNRRVEEGVGASQFLLAPICTLSAPWGRMKEKRTQEFLLSP
jgi:integrase